jgi:hypothetical protein
MHPQLHFDINCHEGILNENTNTIFWEKNYNHNEVF